MIEERLCVCGHDIYEHDDYDFNTHECNHLGCGCLQFRDVEDSDAAAQGEGEKK